MTRAIRIPLIIGLSLAALAGLAAERVSAQTVLPLNDAAADIAEAHAAFLSQASAADSERDGAALTALARTTLALAEQQQPPSAENVGRARYNLALARWLAGDVDAVEDFRAALALLEAVEGDDAEPLIQPLVMLAQSERLYAYTRGSERAFRVANSKANTLESRARRIALQSYGRDTLEFLQYELRTARVSLIDRGSFQSIHSRTSKLGPEGAMLHAEASDALVSVLMRRRRMLKVIEVLEGALERLDAAGIEQVQMRRRFHGRLAFTYEMRGEHDAATAHCLAYAAYSSDASKAQPVFLSEYQFWRYEDRFPLEVPVRVQVDAKGYVTQADLMATDVLSDSVSSKALEAAYEQRFAPRLVEGNAVADENVITSVRVDDEVLSRMFRVPCESEDDRSALVRFLDWSCSETGD